jgi:hypothetical protein
MEIGIALEIDAELERLSSAVTRIEDRLNGCFSTKNYGEGVASIFIGLILMGTDSERLHPVRPFRYRKLYKFTSRITGERTELSDVVTFDVKPNYEGLRRLNAEAAEQFIAAALIEAMDAFSKHQKKFPHFNVTLFTEEFAACLRR